MLWELLLTYYTEQGEVYYTNLYKWSQFLYIVIHLDLCDFKI